METHITRYGNPNHADADRRIIVLGARGGVGTSTIAALIALTLQSAGQAVALTDMSITHGQRVMLTSAGLANTEDPTIEVIDAGYLNHHEIYWEQGDTLVIVTGRDYHSIRELNEWSEHPYASNNIILVHTGPDAALTIDDAKGVIIGRWDPTHIIGFKHDPTTARTIDAGLLPNKFDTITPLALRSLLIARIM